MTTTERIAEIEKEAADLRKRQEALDAKIAALTESEPEPVMSAPETRTSVDTLDLSAAKIAAREALDLTKTMSLMHIVDVVVDAALPHILAQVEARVKPSRDGIADAVLALWPGKTEQEVRKEVAEGIAREIERNRVVNATGDPQACAEVATQRAIRIARGGAR